MSFWEHFAQLRKVLLRIAVVEITAMVVLFAFMPWIFDNVILWPCRADFPTYDAFSFMHGDGQFLPDMSNDGFGIRLINIKLGTQLMTHMSATLALALTFTFPVIVYQLWTFVSPGLYPHERRGARRAFLFGNVMFYLGLSVGYFLVFPFALKFLNDYTLSGSIANQLTLDSYMDNFYGILVAMGLVFEMPLVAWMLGKAGVLKRSFFHRYRKYAIFGCALMAGIITPTSDVFTLLLVFVPLYGLWEFSALLVPKNIKNEQEN